MVPVVAEPPAFVPRKLLVEADAWKTRDPVWREDVDPAQLAAARLQHELAYRYRVHIRDETRAEVARRLGMNRSTLWRLLDGLAPISLVVAQAWAAELGVRIELRPESR